MEHSLFRNQRAEESKRRRSVCGFVQTDHHEGPSQPTTNAIRTPQPKSWETAQTKTTAAKSAQVHHSLSYDTPTTARVLALRLLARAFLFKALLMYGLISIGLHHRDRGTARSQCIPIIPSQYLTMSCLHTALVRQPERLIAPFSAH
jgi:hypothetical protein